MTAVTARPQGVNVVSTFTEDLCEAYLLVVKELSDFQFTKFAVDGGSLKTKDTMLT